MYFFIIRKKFVVAFLILCSVALVLGFVFNSVDIQTSAQVGDGVRLPILMYHSVLQNPSALGKYVVSPETLEADLHWLSANGYTTVLSSDLIAYTRENKPLPEKPIMLTFDDGHANNLLYVLPLLEKYDMRAMICVVGKYSETYSEGSDHNPSYAYLSWEEIRTLTESGRVEIANHSYDMHKQEGRKGASRKRFEHREDYAAILREDLSKTQALLLEHCNITPIAFSYPFGAVCEDSFETVRLLGFMVSLGCAERVNLVTDADSLYCMGRFNRPSGIGTEEFMKRIEK